MDRAVIGPSVMERAEDAYGRILEASALVACALVFAMTLMICADVLLRAVPKRVGWTFEWMVDILGLGCSAFIAYYGARAAFASFKAGSVSIKTLVTPEWWLLSVLPVAFLALSIEMLFRMRRLAAAERAPRDDAVSTG